MGLNPTLIDFTQRREGMDAGGSVFRIQEKTLRLLGIWESA